IWNPRAGTKIRRIPTNQNGGTRSVAFSPDSNLVAIGAQRFFDKDGFRDASSGVVSLANLSLFNMDWMEMVPGWAKPVAFSPDGKSVAVLCGGGSIRFLETETGEVKHEIRPADSPQGGGWNDFAIAPQGHMLAIGGVDNERKGSVEVWSLVRPVRPVQTGVVRVRVLDPGGIPVMGSHMTNIEPEGDTIGKWGGSANLKNGEFLFKGVPPGKYLISAHPNPHNSRDPKPSKWIVVEPNKAVEVELRYPWWPLTRRLDF
ncbi:MAG: hypothetical protein ACYTG0_25475, partial [Planctomycetota bacterium]